jgi:hypothetical protein
MSDSPIIAMTVDQRREEADDHRERLRDDQPEDTGDDHGAVDVRQPVPAAVRRRDDDHRVQHGEGRARDDGQPHTEDPPDPRRLDDRRDPADQQVGADQDRDIGLVETHRRTDDQRDRDGPGVHDEQVLQAQHQQPGQREDLVHRVDGVPRGRG